MEDVIILVRSRRAPYFTKLLRAVRDAGPVQLVTGPRGEIRRRTLRPHTREKAICISDENCEREGAFRLLGGVTGANALFKKVRSHISHLIVCFDLNMHWLRRY